MRETADDSLWSRLGLIVSATAVAVLIILIGQSTGSVEDYSSQAKPDRMIQVKPSPPPTQPDVTPADPTVSRKP